MQKYAHLFNDELLSMMSAALDRGEEVLLKLTPNDELKLLIINRPKLLYKGYIGGSGYHRAGQYRAG